MANDFIITNAVAKAMLDTFDDQANAGTAAVINIYSAGGGVPADADTAITDQTLLAQLVMSATAFGAAADANPNATITADTITDDSSADATGTAAFFRILTQSGGTVICQGTVGTSGSDMNLNTTSITAGSTVSISSCVITMPEQA
ncbi:MAG: hypothetical protein AB7I38_18475 [Dehalococcoidia bacterium]